MPAAKPEPDRGEREVAGRGQAVHAQGPGQERNGRGDAHGQHGEPGAAAPGRAHVSSRVAQRRSPSSRTVSLDLLQGLARRPERERRRGRAAAGVPGCTPGPSSMPPTCTFAIAASRSPRAAPAAKAQSGGPNRTSRAAASPLTPSSVPVSTETGALGAAATAATAATAPARPKARGGAGTAALRRRARRPGPPRSPAGRGPTGCGRSPARRGARGRTPPPPRRAPGPAGSPRRRRRSRPRRRGGRGSGPGRRTRSRGNTDSIAAWIANASARFAPTQPSVELRSRNGWITSRYPPAPTRTQTRTPTTSASAYRAPETFVCVTGPVPAATSSVVNTPRPTRSPSAR